MKLNVKTNGYHINQSQCWRKRNENYFPIQTIKEIEHRRPGITVIDKEKRECKTINIVVTGYQYMKVEELEKITKYKDLRLQEQKLWNVKATVIPVVVGALGTFCEELENNNPNSPASAGCHPQVFIRLSK